MNQLKFKAAQQLETAMSLEVLWKGLFPDHDCPSRLQFLTWASMSSEDLVVFAFNRAARKVQREPMDNDRLGRYVTGVLRNEREGHHIFDSALKERKSNAS